MPQILKTLTPIAKKEHRCMYCGCKIPIGEKYQRCTLTYDGDLYDWVCHTDCHAVAVSLRMFDYVGDEGLDGYTFQESLFQYVSEHYYDEVKDDTREDVRSMTRIEQVRLILADRNKNTEE